MTHPPQLGDLLWVIYYHADKNQFLVSTYARVFKRGLRFNQVYVLDAGMRIETTSAQNCYADQNEARRVAKDRNSVLAQLFSLGGSV